MIRRHELIKKVLIGSIFSSQLTVIGPAYSALAIGQTTDKPALENSISSNGEVKKVVSEKGKTDSAAKKDTRTEIEKRVNHYVRISMFY